MGRYNKQKKEMVDHHLKPRGITNKLVLNAMTSVKREEFLPDNMKPFAYEDRPLPIGEGQTISQPYMVAHMTQALDLKGGEKVLEIGTGSGYAAAVLAEIADEVFTIERHEALAEKAKKVLKTLGYKNIHIKVGDGSKGLKKEAPFDAIVVTAAGPEIPKSLKKQLKPGGRLVIPVGQRGFFQELLKLTRKKDDNFEEEDLGGVAFVPLIGEEGF